MHRLIEADLERWRTANNRKPLVLRGARQVGKTWLVQQRLGPKFDACITVDFEKRRDLHAHFEGSLDPVTLRAALELEFGRIMPGRRLVFFDEIQACPRAIMALRYFHEEMPELHVVAAGSLLEFALDKISVPVGRLHYLHVPPMTFYEYLLAIDKAPMAAATLRPSSVHSKASHQSILEELRMYFFVGGMPGCVSTYRETRSFVQVFQEQDDLLATYREDFEKYTPRASQTGLDTVLHQTAQRVGDRLKYTTLDSDRRSDANRRAFELLEKARLVQRIRASTPAGVPLAANTNTKRFKAALLDVGLMQRLCGVPAESAMRERDLLAIYRGRLAEQFAAQEMIAWCQSNLFFWAREAKSSTAEVDFLTVRDGDIYPVEVKAGAGGRLQSLHLLLKTYPNCPAGLVLSMRQYSELPEQRLTFLPLYAAATVGEQRWHP